MQSRQFHSQSLVNGQSSIFTHDLRKPYSQNLNAFAEQIPCNNWTLGLQHKWHSSFRKFRKPRHSVQNVLACVSKHYSQYHERMEKQSFRIFTGPTSFKSTEIFALREFDIFQPNEVIFSAQ